MKLKPKPNSYIHRLTRAELNEAIRLFAGNKTGVALTKENSSIRIQSRIHRAWDRSGPHPKTRILGAEIIYRP